MNNLLKHLYSPSPFENSKNNIWTDSSFSSFVFNSYFKPEIYGGSKGHDFVRRVSLFISNKFPSSHYKNLLDLGCGPGLYAVALSSQGYNVTGIDYSASAIQYAIKNSKNRYVQYYQDDILSFQLNRTFNICTIIYQTYSTFSYENRRKLLKNIYKHLDDNGLLIFDVPSIHYYNQLSPINIWEYRSHDNPITSSEHLALYSLEKYSDNIILNKSIYIFKDNTIKKFYDWMKCFDKNNISKEISDLFQIEHYFSDIDGTPLSSDSNNLTIIGRKL